MQKTYPGNAIRQVDLFQTAATLKSCFVIRFSLREHPVSVGKVDKSPQILKFLFFLKLLYIPKHRPEIRPSQPPDLHIRQIPVKFLLAGDLRVFLNLRIALDDMEIDL